LNFKEKRILICLPDKRLIALIY